MCKIRDTAWSCGCRELLAEPCNDATDAEKAVGIGCSKTKNRSEKYPKKVSRDSPCSVVCCNHTLETAYGNISSVAKQWGKDHERTEGARNAWLALGAKLVKTCARDFVQGRRLTNRIRNNRGRDVVNVVRLDLSDFPSAMCDNWEDDVKTWEGSAQFADDLRRYRQKQGPARASTLPTATSAKSQTATAGPAYPAPQPARAATLPQPPARDYAALGARMQTQQQQWQEGQARMIRTHAEQQRLMQQLAPGVVPLTQAPGAHAAQRMEEWRNREWYETSQQYRDWVARNPGASRTNILPSFYDPNLGGGGGAGQPGQGRGGGQGGGGGA